MKPSEYFERHDLPTTALAPSTGGIVNQVWVTKAHVLRVGRADHTREARIALAALEVGVRTARPVVWRETYSIWERIEGTSASQAFEVLPAAWQALLDDLAVLHRNPPEPRPVKPVKVWRGRLELLERTAPKAQWSSEEYSSLQRLLGTPRLVEHHVFVHGDAFASNVLVDDRGAYVALIDWGCAGWQCLEAECARLEDAALNLAYERWSDVLDQALVRAMRLDLMLEIAIHGRLSFDRIRADLEVTSC